MNFSNHEPVQLFCPNCGHMITGYKGEDGALKKICDRCKLFVSSKRKNAKKISIEITNPYADEESFK
jgi:DNA-directed RNA polymerase subunit M/transcription elongation factor TFIIS